jgi:hypothetical protein
MSNGPSVVLTANRVPMIHKANMRTVRAPKTPPTSRSCAAGGAPASMAEGGLSGKASPSRRVRARQVQLVAIRCGHRGPALRTTPWSRYDGR